MSDGETPKRRVFGTDSFAAAELVRLGARAYPIVGGRVRLAIEDRPDHVVLTFPENDLSPEGGWCFRAELWDRDQEAVLALVKRGETRDGPFDHPARLGYRLVAKAYGTSAPEEDKKLGGSLLMLAETRARARVLRFAGYGVGEPGAEEVEGKPTLAAHEGGDVDALTNDKAYGYLKEVLEAARADGVDLRDIDKQLPPTDAAEAKEFAKEINRRRKTLKEKPKEV